MLLIVSDRLAEGQRLQRLVAAVGPCALAAPDAPAAAPVEPALVVCDAALDRPGALNAVRAVLARHRVTPATPVLFLDRQGGGEGLAQARAVGACAVLPKKAPDAQVLFTVRRLLEAPRPAGAGVLSVKGQVRKAATALAGIFGAARRGAPVAHDEVGEGARAVVSAVRGERIEAWLDVVRAVDDTVYQHCLVVAGLSVELSARLGVTPKGQRLIAQAALMHDVGKAGIPLDILNKPGPLTREEATLVRTHADVGHRMLVGQGGFDPQTLDIVRHHHEYLDGTGYPDGLSAAALSAPVRMVTICDVYAALIEWRPYKPPLPLAEALRLLDDMGGKLDAGILRTFGALVRGG